MKKIDALAEQVFLILKDTVPRREDDAYRGMMRGARQVSIRMGAAVAFARAIRTLHERGEDVHKAFSDKFLTEKLDDLIFDLRFEDEKNLKSEIPRRAKLLFRELSSRSLNKHSYLIPVMKLRLMKPLEVAGIRIADLDASTFSLVKQRYGVDLCFPGETVTQAIQEMTTANETSTFALVEVEAEDPDSATDLAIRTVDMALDAMRTTTDLTPGDPPYVVRGDFQTTLVLRLRHLNVATSVVTHSSFLVNLVASVPTLIPARVDSWESKLRQLGDLLLKPDEDRTDLEASIVDAVFWFGNGVKDKEPLFKFVKYFIAMESLMVPHNQRGKIVTLARNFTGIMFDQAPEKERAEVSGKMADLYGVRNEIVHTGKRSITADDLVQIERWTQSSILKLQSYTTYPTLDQLIDHEFPLAQERRGLLLRIWRKLTSI